MESETVIEENGGSLQWADWAVIGLTLGASAGIGVYYRFTGGKQKTSEEYFTANKSTGVGLLAMTMMVSFLSGIAMLISSGETYTYGSQFFLVHIGFILATPIVAFFFLPVFYELNTMSVFEYLEKRFGVTARRVASIGNFIQFSFFTGVIIYAPSLALEATTGLDGTISILLIGLICTFYSTIGGIKAVIITDLLQGILMFACIIGVIIVIHVDLEDGIGDVFRIAEEGGRLNLFDFDLDPTARYGLLSTIGSTFLWLTQFAVNQVQVQRMLSAKSLGDAKKALFLNVPMTMSLTILVSFSGLALYAFYSKCDPVVAGKLFTYDMILPYFAKERMTHIPGLTGIFVSGIFSASLSTVSASLNSLAAVALADYLKPLCERYGHELSDEKAASWGKLFALSIGFFSLAVAFLAAKVGSLIQITAAINGAIGGPILGLFTLGMFFESANEFGAVTSTIVALILNSWVIFTPKYNPPFLPTSTEGCQNITAFNPFFVPSGDPESFAYIDRLSFLWHTAIGWACAVLVGLILSFIKNSLSTTSRPPIDPSFFTPFVAARIRRRNAKNSTTGSQVFVLDTKSFERGGGT